MSDAPDSPGPEARSRLPVSSTPREATIPCLRSLELFDGTREVLIEHGGCYYRLRLTHSNKLILTK